MTEETELTSPTSKLPALRGKEDNIMKLNCKRIDFTYTPGEEIFSFPDESGLPFLFDVEEELTADSAAMDAVAAYTQTFNKMGFIETEERDEIYMALRGILDALPDGTLQKDALMEKFEQLRDF